jgi:hypothetical protein
MNLLTSILGIIQVSEQLETPTLSTNWWGIIGLIAIAIFATWLRRRLK